MIVECQKCQTRFRMADDKVTPGGVKVRCSKCQHTFVVKKTFDPTPAPSPELSQRPTGQTMQLFAVSPADLRKAAAAQPGPARPKDPFSITSEKTEITGAPDFEATVRAKNPLAEGLMPSSEKGNLQHSPVIADPFSLNASLGPSAGPLAAPPQSAEDQGLGANKLRQPADDPFSLPPAPPPGVEPESHDLANPFALPGTFDASEDQDLGAGGLDPFSASDVNPSPAAEVTVPSNADPFSMPPPPAQEPAAAVADPFAMPPPPSQEPVAAVADPFAMPPPPPQEPVAAVADPFAMPPPPPQEPVAAVADPFAMPPPPPQAPPVGPADPFTNVPASERDPFSAAPAPGDAAQASDLFAMPPGPDAGTDPLAGPAGFSAGATADDLFAGLGLSAEPGSGPLPFLGEGEGGGPGFVEDDVEAKTRVRTVDDDMLQMLASYSQAEQQAKDTVEPASPAVNSPKPVAKDAQVGAGRPWLTHLLQGAAGLAVALGLLFGVYRFRGGQVAELELRHVLNVVLFGELGQVSAGLRTRSVAVQSYPINAQERRVLVVGEVENSGDQAVPAVLVSAQLFAADGSEQDNAQAYAGAEVDPFLLRYSANTQEFLNKIQNLVAENKKSLQPGEVWPFTLAFAITANKAEGGQVKLKLRSADRPPKNRITRPQPASNVPEPTDKSPGAAGSARSDKQTGFVKRPAQAKKEATSKAKKVTKSSSRKAGKPARQTKIPTDTAPPPPPPPPPPSGP